MPSSSVFEAVSLRASHTLKQEERILPGLMAGMSYGTSIIESMNSTRLAEKMNDSAILLQRLRLALERHWDASTSVDLNWTSDRPSRGQCAVTALIVQDYLGGHLVRADVDGVSHYWNRLPDGSEVDFTRDQFDEFTPGPFSIRSRLYVLSFPQTARRYEMLKRKIFSELPLSEMRKR